MSNASDIRELKKKQEQLTNGVISAFEQVSFDYARLQTMMFALLNDLGKADTLTCAECGEEVMRPILKDLPLEEICPMCNGNLIVHPTQTTVEDWDNAKVEEE